ncbi:nucleoporin Nup186/Nup192/Nup205 [Vararia minispora EC-137]|uniref:Nucleoporin Nup186/Nup192/Nup205 n=1 Tax=Vararia minispora EC-137 TaxID=1314806 RepID=A0ACB8QMY9_9AGAM|nr:nucleoporin Nup186/Nup192/Nup205 [Vararia minispora EC-137]
MAPLSHLRSLLLQVASAGFVNDDQELFDILTTHRATLAKVLDFGPPNEVERKGLQGGKMTLEKTEFTISNNLATQVMFLAQVLECSESYVASLVHYVMTAQPNLAPADLLEAVILEHHERRRDTVQCLQYLVDISLICNTPNRAPDCTRTHSQVDLFFERHILPSLSSKTWDRVQKMEQEISRAHNAVQNAGSETVIQVGNNTRLGQPVLSARLQSLQVERRHLAFNLYLVACLGHLTVSDLEKIVPWLQQSPRHPLTYHVLTTLLAVFDAVDPASPGAALRHKLAVDPATVKLMKTRLNAQAGWKDAGLKSVILLKWPLFMTEILRREPLLEHKDGFQTDQLEENVWTAVENGAFGYMDVVVSQLQRRNGTLPISYDFSEAQEAETLPEVPSDDFKSAILQSFETLVRLLIRHASSLLKKVKLRQEDHIFASTPNRSRMFRSTTARAETLQAQTPPPRHDIAKFVTLIGNLYSTLPPERALQFWAGSGLPDTHRPSYLEFSEASSASSGKLSAFLQWVVWSTRPDDLDMCIALYKMLAGLANGQMCSELTLNFLGRNTGEVAAGNAMPGRQETVASWQRMFKAFESWANPQIVRPTPQASPQPGFMTSQHPQHQQQPAVMSFKEMLLGQGYLRLLEVIAKHSVPCRLALTTDPHFRVLHALVSVIPLGTAVGIPLELKGSVYRTLAALCMPGTGSTGVEICRQVWVSVERSDVINVRGVGGLLAKKGAQEDLERVEEPQGIYPSSIHLLSLLGALIHTPKQLSLRARITDDEQINTVPETLGLPYRQPGIQPYIAFVIDEVFLRIPNREYRIPRERWLMNEGCLAFIERCLASYDLEAFLTTAEANQVRPETLPPLTAHPGYDILQRLLTSSPLQMSILGYLVDGVDGFDKNLQEEEPLFPRIITRVLRIVHRVLEIQDIFLDVLVPLLLELRDVQISGQVQPRSYYVGFDAAISFGSSYAPAIGAYVTFIGTHAELGILSVKILSILVKSSAFTNFTTLLERSSESERIIAGYRQILDAENLDEPDLAEQDADKCTGAGAPSLDTDDVPTTLVQAARLAVLDLLSRNTIPESTYPNIAHLILFGSTDQTSIQDPRALGARRVGIHAVLEKVSSGVPRLDRSGRALEQAGPQQLHPLFTTVPELAERFYRVIYNLCMHPRTSDFTMRYLRLHEDFFARQLTAIPFKAPATGDPTIEVRYPDGGRVTTTVLAFTAFLRLRAHIFDLTALELHATTGRGDRKAAGTLLEIVYGNEEQYSDADAEWQDEVFGRPAFRERGQSSMRVVEYVQSLAFDWVNSLAVDPQSLELLAGLNLSACLRTDNKGCEVVDRDVLLILLAHAQRTAQARGRIAAPADVERLAAEKAYVLESAVVENQRREVGFARAKGFESWRRMIDMSLVECFEQLPRAGRETILSDLLAELPPIIRSDAPDVHTAVLLAELALALVTRLREDRWSQRLLTASAAGAVAGGLSTERLHALLKSVVECVLEHRAELVRGNLYAALINYFHLITPSAGQPASDANTDVDPFVLSLRSSALSSSLALSTSQAKSALGKSGSRPNASAAEAASLGVLKPYMERLVAVVARDASDGTEVWRTVAFVLLDGLVHLARTNAQAGPLQVLARRGFLSSFVKDLADADRWLLAMLKPDPDDLNALYVYEAKMSLLVRVAQSRAGAERLLDARAIPVLANCDFLDAQPEADQAFIDKGGFLPSAIQRYHQLLLPALQLINAILATLGQGHTTAASQTLEFLNAHRDTIVILLKSNADEIPLAVLEEIYLLAVLCGSVLPKVEKHELMSTNTGFGSIHSSLLSLAAKSFGGNALVQRVRPQSDAELADAVAREPGYAHESKFDIAVQDMEQMLRKALIAYMGTASEFTETDITLVISPIMSAPRPADAASRLIATVPTVSDALEALSALADTLGEQLKQMINIDAELAARDLIRIEDVQEILPLPERALLDELDVGQKRRLICTELARIQTRFRARATVVLSSLEQLLLLLWRHTAHYASGAPPRAAAPGVVRALQTTDVQPDAFVRDAARRAGPVLAKVAGLDLDQDGWRANRAYVEVLTAKTREALGIPVEDEGGLGF